MNDRRKTVAALTIIIGFIVFVVIVIGIIVSSRKVISPVPEEGAIKVMFISPTTPPQTTGQPTPEITAGTTP